MWKGDRLNQLCLSRISPCDPPPLSGDRSGPSGGRSVWRWPHGGAGEVPPVSSCPSQAADERFDVFGWSATTAPLPIPPGPLRGADRGPCGPIEASCSLWATAPVSLRCLRWRQAASGAVDSAAKCHFLLHGEQYLRIVLLKITGETISHWINWFVFPVF